MGNAFSCCRNAAVPQEQHPISHHREALKNCLKIQATAQAVQPPCASVSPLGLIDSRRFQELALQLEPPDLPSLVAAALGGPKPCCAKAQLGGKSCFPPGAASDAFTLRQRDLLSPLFLAAFGFQAHFSSASLLLSPAARILPARLCLPEEDGDGCISHTLSSSPLLHRHSCCTAPIIGLANDTNFPSQALPII